MAEVRVGDHESLDAALKRLKRMMQQDGILAEMRRHEHYVKPSDRRKQKARARRRRG